MRILDDWQYQYIEKSLYNYFNIQNSTLETESKMVKAITEALNYFKGTAHETMMREFYFNHKHHRKHFTKAGHYRYVCCELIHTEESNGYVIRKEIVYRIAMMCYGLQLFKTPSTEEKSSK